MDNDSDADRRAHSILSRRTAMRLLASGATAAVVTGVTSSLPFEPAAAARGSHRTEELFDSDWKFYFGDPPGAPLPGFDDSAWQPVELPHDFGITDISGGSTDDSVTADPARFSSAVGPSTIGPFQQTDSGVEEWNAENAWTIRGVGWYRKTFTLTGIGAGERIELRFDGVEQEADVYVNGTLLGFHPYGYTGFTFDVTPYVAANVPNVVAVRFDTSGYPSRWYAGSGIYRHVWLLRRGAISIPASGLYVTTPQVSAKEATVAVAVSFDADRGNVAVDIEVSVLDPYGTLVAGTRLRTTSANGSKTAMLSVHVPDPRRWDIDAPWLYQCVATLLSGSNVLDSVSTAFGIRTVTVDVVNGFRLNGRTIKLEGGCAHSTNGFLGAASIDRAEVRKVELLKAAGFNAVRTAHNPPSPAFLDACDQIGLLVYEDAFDTWDQAKRPQDYAQWFSQWALSDLEAMVTRDRNHPSVVIWSLGNEIADVGTPTGIQIGATLYNYVRSLDPTRPIVNSGGQQFDGSLTAPDWNYVDIGDFHYDNVIYQAAHAAQPTKALMSSEGYPYDFYNNWQPVKTLPYLIGDFVWTALDYVGESGIGWNGLQAAGLPVVEPNLLQPGSWCCLGPYGFYHPFPWFVSGCGDVDLVGTRKPQSYYRAVVTGRSPIAMFVMRPTPSGTSQQIGVWGWPDELPSWTWPSETGNPLLVNVYTSGDQIDLLLNGQVIQSQTLSASNECRAQFSVAYQTGTLQAVAYLNGTTIGSTELATVGAAAALRLVADRTALLADRNDLSYVIVEVVDAAGRLVPDAVNDIAFSVEGQGEIVGTGNGNPRNMASFTQPHHWTYQGRALAIVRPFAVRGTIILTATASALGEARLRLSVG